MRLTPYVVKIENILLDPNNPRFYDIEAHQKIIYSRYPEEIIQQNAITKLLGNKAFDVEQLKESIKSNGYVPLEKVVVRRYDDKYFLVVEGNRRICAVKSIVHDYLNGILELQEDIIKSLENIEILILERDNDDEELTWDEILIQGIRHISGTKEWGAYQKARFVVSLKDEYGKDFNTISSSLGLGPKVTTRYYRTFKALRQMFDDDTYSDYAHPNLFTHFEEMIKSPSIQIWLGWDNNEYKFKNLANLEIMYDLISEKVDENGDEVEPKLPAHRDIRSFSKILGHDKAKTQFLSGNVTINQALTIANPLPPSPWQETAQDCLKVLRDIKVDDIMLWTDTDTDLLNQILNQIDKIMTISNRLRNNNGN